MLKDKAREDLLLPRDAKLFRRRVHLAFFLTGARESQYNSHSSERACLVCTKGCSCMYVFRKLGFDGLEAHGTFPVPLKREESSL